MRTIQIAVSCLWLGALGCATSEPLPPLTEPAKAAAASVSIASLDITERELKAKAQSGAAAVTLTLTPREPAPLLERLTYQIFYKAWWEPDSGSDAPRPCTVHILDRDGELLRQDGATIGVTDTRSLEDFEADLKVAEGLAALLSQNPQAWDLYRWEIRDVAFTANELQGLRGPTQ